MKQLSFRKLRKKAFNITALVLLALAFTACSKDEKDPEPGPPVPGLYNSRGYFYTWNFSHGFTLVKDVVVSGTNSVDVDFGDFGPSGFGYRARLTTDPLTNLVTIVAAPGAAGGAYTQFNTTVPSILGGPPALWSESGLCNNTYDPATKTFYLRYGYVGANGWSVVEEILVKQ